MYTMDKSTKRWTFASSKIDEPFGVQSHFLNDFWELTLVGVKVVLLVGDDTMGEYLHPYTEFGALEVYTHMYIVVLWTHQRRDGLSHYQNSMSLSTFGSILKYFWEPMSIGVKVIFLVGHDKTLYMRTNKKIDSHITKIRRAFRRSIPF